jgi:hypothetical protein
MNTTIDRDDERQFCKAATANGAEEWEREHQDPRRAGRSAVPTTEAASIDRPLQCVRTNLQGLTPDLPGISRYNIRQPKSIF